MRILDANVILRYLLRDIPEMADQARAAVMEGSATTIEVMAEVVYVLASVYKTDRKIISEVLSGFVLEVYISHKPTLQYALRLYGEKKLDFVDCVLAGYHHVEHQEIMTFDKKLRKTLNET